jgi:hypothetical protein
MRYGEATLTEAMSILMRNLTRISNEAGDDEEKYTLSLAILNYIKASTLAPI